MFKQIKNKVQNTFNKFSSQQMYIVDIEKDELFNAYLEALPEAFRQEHNCNCCKQFLNEYGKIVTIDEEYNIHSLWEFEVEYPYDNIPKALDKLIKSKKIFNKFIPFTYKCGTDKNYQLKEGKTIEWQHFYGELSQGIKLVAHEDRLNLYKHNRINMQVFYLSLKEFSLDAIETLLKLVKENSTYRLEPYKKQLEQLLEYKITFAVLDDNQQLNFCWKHADISTRFINTGYGTLFRYLSIEYKKYKKSLRQFMSKQIKYGLSLKKIEKEKVDKARYKQRLLEIIHKKQDTDLENKSLEDLLKEVESLE